VLCAINSVNINGKSFIQEPQIPQEEVLPRPTNPVARLLDALEKTCQDEEETQPLLRGPISPRPQRFILTQEQRRLLVTLYLMACACERYV